MFNQKLRSIFSFFTTGKKNILSAAGTATTGKQVSKNTDTQNTRLLYQRDINEMQLVETKPDSMQHDWWIN